MRRIATSIILLIFLVQFPLNANAQSIDMSYNVKVGDNQIFRISKYRNRENGNWTNERTGEYVWEDGTKTNETMKIGDLFTVAVCNIEGNGINQSVYVNFIIHNKNTRCEKGIGFYIEKVTENRSYYEEFTKIKNTTTSIGTFNTSCSLVGNIFHSKITFDSFTTTETSYNIKTGWLTNFSSLIIGYNGNIDFQNEFINTGDSTSIVVSSNSLGLPSMIFFYGILIPIILLKRKKYLR